MIPVSLYNIARLLLTLLSGSYINNLEKHT